MPEDESFIQKVRRDGASLTVTLPKRICELKKISEGDYIVLKVISVIQQGKNVRGDEE